MDFNLEKIEMVLNKLSSLELFFVFDDFKVAIDRDRMMTFEKIERMFEKFGFQWF